jgi:hypothetical protein
VRDGGEDAGAHRIDPRHPCQVADDRVGLLGQTLQQGTLHDGCRGDVEVAEQRHHDAAVAGGLFDVHGSAFPV